MKTKTKTQTKFRWGQDQDQDEREDWIRSSLRADELCFSPIHWKKVKKAKKFGIRSSKNICLAIFLMLPLKICCRIDIPTSQSKRSIFVNKKVGWIYKIYSVSHKLRQVKVLRPAGTRQLLSAVMISLEPVQWETASVQDIFLYSTSPQALDQLLRMRLRSRLPKLLLSLLLREHWDKSPGWKRKYFQVELTQRWTSHHYKVEQFSTVPPDFQ